MSLVEFWRRAATLPRMALGLAALSAGVMLGTLFGLRATGPGLALYAMHFGVMGLGLLLFGQVVLHHFRSATPAAGEQAQVEIPRALQLLTGVALVLCVLLFVTTFSPYGEGGPELRGGRYFWIRNGRPVRALSLEQYTVFQGSLLRAFAAAWLTFSLLIAWAGQVVSARRRRAGGR
jgi:hypothetical protein